MDAFMIKALIGGAGVALMCGPLGCFIAWKRLAYFGDAIGHSALLGVALSLLFQVNATLAIVCTSALFAFALFMLERRGTSGDSLLGVLAHGSLAAGLVIIALLRYPFDIQAYLFGDILLVTTQDILLIYGVAIVTLALLLVRWRPLMLLMLNEDIARVEGVNVPRLKLLLMLMIALVIAVSIKVVGMLLITSMLIIPAAAARSFARTPRAMALVASGLGLLAVAGGLYASYTWDTPSGPSIILAAIVVFLTARLAQR
jgi:zinc transport system permease protein